MAEKTKTIGIIGGGQLGLMIVEQAHLLGARTLCLDPAPDAPAFALSDGHIVAAYDDAAALEELCRRSDVVTYEFENVPGSVLIPLEKKYNIPQGFRPLYDSQDRLREKDNARANGLRTPLYAAVDDEASLRAALAEIGFPAVLKTRTLGYDGHGQLVLKDEADVPRALPMLSVPCILEAFVPFDFEASIVMVSDGERVIHFPIGGTSTATVSSTCASSRRGDGRRPAQPHGCGRRAVHEILPLPRDPRHRVLHPRRGVLFQRNGAAAPQFGALYHRGVHDQPVPRTGALPAGRTVAGAAARGADRDEEHFGAGSRSGRESRRRKPPGVHVHLYGKTESRPKRKMGHITFVGIDAGEYGAAWADRFVK